MMKRAEHLFKIYWQDSYSKTPFNMVDNEERIQWYNVACEEARFLESNIERWKDEIDRIKAETATMVKRKHYTDAIKSLSVCQQQIETMMVELRQLDSKNRIAQDASIVLGLLEAIIDYNPDMQTKGKNQ